MKTFGIWPWISGGIIMLAMLFIYSSVPDNTKRGQFEIFSYENHHMFVIFFILLLVHGKTRNNSERRKDVVFH